MCEQKRYGDSYRNPISNTYFSPTDDAKYPSASLWKLEKTLNKMFKIYVTLYYSTANLCSIYCWELG